ncbi:MAG: MFS transporter [Helicobacteraceae bacterium]|jgi:MFS family permease|nr:MFS transporter [Helicobacteraceae bacterium]
MQENNPKVKVVLWLVASLTMLSGAAISASLPGISSHFLPPNPAGGEENEILSRLILTIPAIAIAITAPFAGVIVHKFGRMKPLYIGLVLYALFGVSGIFAETIAQMLIGRVGLGVAVAVIMTVGTTLTGDYFQSEEERAKFMSMQGVFVTLSGVFFLSGGGLLSDLSWRAPFSVYFVSLAILPLVILYLYEPPRPKETPTKQESSLFGAGGYWSAFPVFCVAFFTMVIFFIVPTQLPFLVMETLGGSGKETGLIMGTGPLFAAIASYNYNRLRRRFSLREIYIFVCVSQGLGLAAVGFASAPWQLYAPFVLAGLGNGLAMANAYIWFLQVAAPAKRAKLSGILTGSFFFGQFSSPLFVHPLLAFMSLNKVFSLFGAFLLIAALTLFIARPALLRDARRGADGKIHDEP